MYLDHNAGGRVRPEVADRLSEWFRSGGANPSSLHEAGRRSRSAIEDAREDVARLVDARPAEIVFTSGGTEANNLAIQGASAAEGHLVTTPIEHASVVASVEARAARGAFVTWLTPGSDGSVSPDAVVGALREDTTLVSIGWANGEIGTVQPVAEITAAVRAARPSARVHTDAVQAVTQLPVSAAQADVDLMSLSGHKLGAPAGIGALVVRRETPLGPQLYGGPQERERRAGTENAAGIVAFGLAARLALGEREAYAARAAALTAEMWSAIAAAVAPVERFGPLSGGVPGTLAIGFPDLRGDALAAALDLRGVAVSTGSACAASAPEPSHVLRAIGHSDALALGGLRLSVGPELQEVEARSATSILIDVVRTARARRTGRPSSGAPHAA